MSPSHHPTVLIGYGTYGLQVMRSFLAGAAARGALVWDDHGVGSLNERRLRSLSLFWVRDPLEPSGEGQQAGLLTETGYELMEDLYAQVEEFEGVVDDVRVDLAAAVDREKRRLLDARRRIDSDSSGLDVIILAQLIREESVGSLRDVIEPAMLQLHHDPAFRTVQEGGGNTLLNFIEILDFEEYWAPTMAPVRATLQQVLRENEEAFAAGRPTIGRVYLFDSNTPGGHRSPDSRMQEVVLLLELLLLEGLRSSPDARVLYRRERVDVPPVCSVGVRVLERSSGLLRRLAAAAFAQGWLTHIGSEQAGDGGSPFEELVAPFRPARIARVIDQATLDAATKREIESVGRTLLAVTPEEPDWGERLRAAAAVAAESAIRRLSQFSGTQSTSLASGVRKSFRDDLEHAVTAAMQERNPSWTIGAVIRELRRLEEELADAITEAGPGSAAAADAEGVPNVAVTGDVFEAAATMQREYVMYLAHQVQIARLKVRWWTRAAIMFALAFSPVAVRAFTETWVTSPIPTWAVALVSAALLSSVFWLIGSRMIHPALQRAAERAREYYTDPERGRLAERVRQVTASPAVEGRIQSYAHRLDYGLRQYVLGGVVAELKRVRGLLCTRRQEVEWLHRQVDEFLLSYQVDASGELPVFEEGRLRSFVREPLEGSEDLESVAQTAPRNVARFRELVSSRRLFNGWSQPYCDTFLHPLPFLDALSVSFQDRLELDAQELGKRATRIATFLQRDLQMSVCFRWLQAGGLPAPVRASLFPAAWDSLPGVRMALNSTGFGTRALVAAGAERLYLIESILGISTELLVSPQ